jgi:pilus assembly protein CpaD
MKSSMSRLMIAAAAAALASGCAGAWNGADEAISVAEEHPITVDSQIVTLTLDVDEGTLSTTDRARLRAFADAYLTNGHGPLSVTSPSGAGTGRSSDVAAEARKALNDAGVAWEDMNGANYIASEGGSRQVVLSYTHYVATASDCGIWKGDLARSYGNLRSPNFGCATQNNIAAMVADPRDLVEPAGETPADAPARIRGVTKYREGAKTASETDSTIKTQVSSQ